MRLPIVRAAAGLNRSIAAGCNWPRKIALRAAIAALSESNGSRKLRSTSGIGCSLKLTTAIAASVPKQPIISFAMSSPATFFTTMPPDFTSLPSSVTNCHADDEVARRAV